jgi:hypothetical protein
MSNYISSFWSRLAESSLCELVELVGDKVPLPDIDTHRRDRIFNSWRTFWLFLGQVLSSFQSCREALIKARSWILLTDKKDLSHNTSGYCQARGRLDQRYLDTVHQEVVGQINGQVNQHELWYGRHVKVVDGSSVSMPDTPQNQALYPQPSGQAEGCGFPVMKIVVNFSLATGILLDWCKSSLHVHDKILWQDMWHSYEADDIVLGDRAFCGFADFWMLSKKKVDCVMRLHQARKGGDIIEEFDNNDYLVEWKKQRLCDRPTWVSEQLWKQMPDALIVRYITINVDIPRYRTRKIRLATTLLNPQKYPAAALADLYRRRWMAELFLRDMKTTMRMDILRCKTPEMIHKELSMFIIAYNLIRTLIWQAASNKGIDPYRISFTAAMVTIRQWANRVTAVRNRKEKKRFINMLINIIATHIIPVRKKMKRNQELQSDDQKAINF